MWKGTISYNQVQILIGIFAKLTPSGWEIPDWLGYLERQVIYRDYFNGEHP